MNTRLFSYVDWHLLTPVIILAILSLSTLFSINIGLFQLQLFFFLFSLFVYIVFSHVHFGMLKMYVVPFYVLGITSLLFVLVLGIESRGAVRWIDFFGIRLQLSEILKPFFTVSLAYYLGERNASIKTFFLIFFYVGIIALLIQKQPDLGNALIYLTVSICVLLYYGFPLRWFGALGVLFLLCLPLMWQFLHEYQKKRILTFLHPTSDPLGTSYNAIQSVIAVGSGMFFGKGLGEGTQSELRFLPERHTDFIFATLSEDFGFFGSTVLLICFGYIILRIIRIIRETDNKAAKIFCCASFFLFLTQLFFNVGMNMGLLPIVGITLPFVSYGGSSVLSNFIFLGILSSISASHKQRDVLAIR